MDVSSEYVIEWVNASWTGWYTLWQVQPFIIKYTNDCWILNAKCLHNDRRMLTG